ncbi:hypothetical protein ACRRTK_006899 [Alexandromys fortis]
MEDRLDEAIHVLRSHAVGTANDLHGLLPGHGALTTSFAGPMPLGGRHAGLVSGGHPEDGLNSGASLLHNHASLPSQPSSLSDLSQRPPDSYSGLGRAGATAGVSEIKREEKDDEENASVADAEEDKKDLKAPRTRTSPDEVELELRKLGRLRSTAGGEPDEGLRGAGASGRTSSPHPPQPFTGYLRFHAQHSRADPCNIP